MPWHSQIILVIFQSFALFFCAWISVWSWFKKPQDRFLSGGCRFNKLLIISMSLGRRCIMARCIKILALKITRLLPKPLKTWTISFVLPCAQAGFPISGQRHPCCRPARGAGHVGASRLSRLCFCLLLALISRDVAAACFWPCFFNECQAKLQILFLL